MDVVEALVREINELMAYKKKYLAAVGFLNSKGMFDEFREYVVRIYGEV
jgi:hypothetical protein